MYDTHNGMMQRNNFTQFCKKFNTSISWGTWKSQSEAFAILFYMMLQVWMFPGVRAWMLTPRTLALKPETTIGGAFDTSFWLLLFASFLSCSRLFSLTRFECLEPSFSSCFAMCTSILLDGRNTSWVVDHANQWTGHAKSSTWSHVKTHSTPLFLNWFNRRHQYKHHPTHGHATVSCSIYSGENDLIVSGPSFIPSLESERHKNNSYFLMNYLMK